MPTGQEIMVRAGVLLQDEAHVRWPLTELADWINQAQRAIVLAKPSACSGTSVLALDRGTLQTIPAEHLALLDVNRNILGDGSDRTLGGRAIRAAKRELIDSQEPRWHDGTIVRFQREVRNFIFDEQNPREFYVYPGNDGNGRVEAVTSRSPTALVADGDAEAEASYAATLALPAPYDVPIVDYVLSRAYAKDDVTGNAGLSQLHYQQFATAIGLKIQVEGATSPNARRVK